MMIYSLYLLIKGKVMNVKKSYRYLLIALFLMLLVGCGDKKISGEVRDIFNNPIEGVVVSIANSAFEATTDEDGKYSIDYVPGDIELLFKHKEYISGNLKINLSVKEDFPAKQVFLYPNAKKTGMYFFDKDKKEIRWIKSMSYTSNMDNAPYIESGKATFILYVDDSKEYTDKNFYITDVFEMRRNAPKVKRYGRDITEFVFSDLASKCATKYDLKRTVLDKHHIMLDARFPDNKTFSWIIKNYQTYNGIRFNPTFNTTSDLEKIRKDAEKVKKNISTDTPLKSSQKEMGIKYNPSVSNISEKKNEESTEIKNNVETTKEVKSKNKPFTHTYQSKYGNISITAKRLEDRLVELDISMTNNSNYDWGWLSVSFPNLQSKSSVKGSEKIGFVTVKSYGQGSKIYNKNLKKAMISDYLLVEGEGKKWQKNSVKSMKILVQSQTENGEMIVNVRGSFKPKKGKAVAFPSSDENGVVIGQQGYENYRILVP